MVTAEPLVTDAEAQKAIGLAKTAVSAPVLVRVNGITADIPPSAIAGALSFTAQNGTFAPALDGNALRAAIAPHLTGVETPGRDATWDVSSGRPVVVPAKVGRGVNPDLLATDVLGVIGSTDPAARVIDAQIGTIPPKLTTEKAQSLGVVEQLSTFTQHFPYAAYRVQNIGQAAKRINGTLLLPGDMRRPDEKITIDRLEEILALNLADDVASWELDGDGAWHRVATRQGIGTQRALEEAAMRRGSVSDRSRGSRT